jgi:tetratricopeptide (TPR) repeat protein
MLIAAGESAMHRGAYVAARTQLEHAAAVAVEEQQAAASLALAKLDVTEARWEGAIERLTIAEDAQAGNPSMRSDVLALRSRVYWVNGRWDEALEAANGAVAALAGLPESGQLARALARRCQIEMLKNRHEAIEHAREAIAVAERVGDVFAGVNARINLFTARAAEGEGLDADEILEIVEAATSVGATRRPIAPSSTSSGRPRATSLSSESNPPSLPAGRDACRHLRSSPPTSKSRSPPCS